MFETNTVAGCDWISISTLNFCLSPIDDHCNCVNNAILHQMYSTPFHPPDNSTVVKSQISNLREFAI